MRAYLDSCERCGQYNVAPVLGLADGAFGIVCGYRCHNCRVVWTCSWTADADRVTPPESTTDLHVTALVHEQAAINRSHKHAARNRPAA